jgi:ABC-type lipoprotein release transport system permease subunit
MILSIQETTVTNKAFYLYAFDLLRKDASRHFVTFALFFVIVFLLFSVLFISTSLQHDQLTIVQNEPEILIENYRGGKKTDMDDFFIQPLYALKGVEKIIPRVIGNYYFEQAGVYFTVIGIDFFASNFNKQINKFTEKKITFASKDLFFVGSGVKKSLEKFYYKNDFTVYTQKGDAKTVTIIPLNDKSFALLGNNIILCDISLARELLALETFEYSDVYLSVPNEAEIPNLAAQIRTLYPTARITTKEEKISQIRHLYDTKGGIFLTLFIVVLLSFMILLYQKTLFSFASEKKEIGILRAVGWKITDIIGLKIVQNLFIALSGYFSALLCAYVFIFKLDAPLLQNIFVGSDKTLFIPHFTPSFGMGELLIVFLLGVVPFVASVLFPVWKLSVIDPTEVMK